MNIKIHTSYYILNFEVENFDALEAYSTIAHHVKNQLGTNDERLKDWRLEFSFVFNNARSMLIYRKGRSYPMDKYREITVHLPFPTIDAFAWGVPEEDYLYKNIGHLDHLVKNFDALDVDFSKFHNRADYILDSMKRAIRHVLQKGVKVNGIMVKAEDVEI